jgi:hypothetical protein
MIERNREVREMAGSLAGRQRQVRQDMQISEMIRHYEDWSSVERPVNGSFRGTTQRTRPERRVAAANGPNVSTRH